MTVSSSVAKTVHLTNATVSEYTFNFKAFKENELLITVVNPEDSSTIKLEYGIDYSVSALGADEGGLVKLNSSGRAKAANKRHLVILRNMPFIQEIDYRPHDIFPAETHEKALDIAAMERQELREMISRAILAPPDQDNAISYERLIQMKEGPVGPIGAQGPTGEAGLKGEKGDKGETGRPGAPGLAPLVDIIDCGGPHEQWVSIIDGGVID